MSKKFLLTLLLIIAVSLPLMLGPALADSPLNEPPRPPLYGPPAGSLTPVLAPSATVNPQNRNESSTFYQTNYPIAAGVTIGWTGDHTTCNAGTTSQAFRDAVLQRINYFRNMAGLPSVTLLADFNQKAQAAALMMSVNNNLDHNPPMSWTCYSADGATGASNSNLSGGSFGWEAIDRYMQDPGSGNFALGHRRWIIYPPQQQMGTGDVPGGAGTMDANALYVAGPAGARPTPRDEFVAWPPPGYVPYQVIFPKWSFSYPGADFSGATISMTRNGTNLGLTNLNSHTQIGFGDNTLGWTPNVGLNDFDPWPKPTADTVYTVNITNVIINGQPRNFSYQVIIFDPATGGDGNNYTVHLPLVSRSL